MKRNIYLLVLSLLILSAIALAACQPETVVETVIVEKEGETITVVETVIVEKDGETIIIGGLIIIAAVLVDVLGVKEIS